MMIYNIIRINNKCERREYLTSRLLYFILLEITKKVICFKISLEKTEESEGV